MKDELVFDEWLKIYHREINNKRYNILKNHDAVAAIISNEFNEVLLVKQFRPALMKETLEIPAGCVDVEGEDLTECMIREIQEECNLGLTKLLKVITYQPIIGFSNSKTTIFKIVIKKEDLKCNIINDNDVTEAIWMSFDELGKRIFDGEITDSKTIISYFYLKSL